MPQTQKAPLEPVKSNDNNLDFIYENDFPLWSFLSHHADKEM